MTGKVGTNFKIEPTVKPADAANQVLSIAIDNTELATSNVADNSANGAFNVTLGNTAGTTTAHFTTTDGSNVTVDVPITVTAE